MNCWRLLPVVITSSIIMTSLPMIFGDITMFEADSIALRFWLRCLLLRELVYWIASISVL